MSNNSFHSRSAESVGEGFYGGLEVGCDVALWDGTD